MRCKKKNKTKQPPPHQKPKIAPPFPCTINLGHKGVSSISDVFLMNESGASVFQNWMGEDCRVLKKTVKMKNWGLKSVASIFP